MTSGGSTTQNGFPEESIGDPTETLERECDNPEPSRYELLMNELERGRLCCETKP